MQKDIIVNGQEFTVREDGAVLNTRTGEFFYGNGKTYKKYKHNYIHRLIAIAFIPNPEGKKEVNHKDSNKMNNHVDNLEWVTHKENINYIWTHHPDREKMKQRRSDNMKGNQISKGRKASEETRKKLSEMRKGKPAKNKGKTWTIPEDKRENYRKAALARWAKKRDSEESLS